MSKRTAVLELAVLGLLQDTEMHGYELRKRLNALLGWGRAFSYGTLYPCLRDLTERGWIAADDQPGEPAAAAGAGPATGRTRTVARTAPGRARRAKIVYRLTPEGKERFADLLSQAGPSSWDDEQFGVHFAFFAQTDADVRLRILEGRRSRLEERLESFRTSLQRTRARLDTYTTELHRHGLESVEREVRWLNELIDSERRGSSVAPRSRKAAAGSRTSPSPPPSPQSRSSRGAGS